MGVEYSLGADGNELVAHEVLEVDIHELVLQELHADGTQELVIQELADQEPGAAE